MNKILNKTFVAVLLCALCAHGYAADVSDRTTDCGSIQSCISELAAIENPSDSQMSELTQLQNQYRNSCAKSASGRRTTTAGRVSTATVAATSSQVVTPVVETVIMTGQTVLNDYISKRQSLCDDLKGDIATLKNAGASDADVKPVQNQYDADCVDIDKSAVVEVDAETAAANVAAGLCTDGSKPNQFGCCEGETFKDMGNLVFACCPDDGGECYPPINSGDSL